MKFHNLFAMIVLLFCTTSVFSQFKVISDGTVKLNPYLSAKYNSSSLYTEFKGSISFEADHWTKGIRTGSTVNGSWTMPAIFPNSNWYGSLGTSSKEFGFAYIDHIYYDQLTDYSDKKIKENIKEIKTTDTKEKIKLLRPVSYDLKESFYDNVPEEAREAVLKNRKNKVGLIAQEVQEVFPDLVVTDESNGLLGVNYIDFIPYLIAFAQEQQATIEQLQVALSKLKKSQGTINSNKRASLDSIFNTTAYIEQNTPNPFSIDTEIKYYVPKESSNAAIFIFDLQGKLLKTNTIDALGEGSITINSWELNPGMYLYTLIVDGHEVDTKRMIITE